MRFFHLIFREIGYRKVNSALSLLAVVIAVALFVAFVTSGDAYRKETRRIQLGMGQNLRIIPKETAMDQFWSKGFSDHTMPEEYVHRFAALEGYEYTHLTATLQQSLELQGRRIILTGILPEVMPPGRNQPPMTFSVEPGTTYIGSEVARFFDLEPGHSIDLRGKSLSVEKCLAETGSSDDIRVYAHLGDVQQVLGLEGRINEIRALECLCLIEAGDTDLDPLSLAQQQLAEILPTAKVLLLQGIAEVRQKQRAAMEGYLALIMPIVIVACGIWIGALAMINVRQRFEEIGIMRALGYCSKDVAFLFLGRSVLIGLLGALLGFLIGTGLALAYGPAVFQFTAKSMSPQYIWLFCCLIIAPIFAAVATLIPTVSAITWDPATSMRKE
jgi:ABC-type antimicrobial peptide transport system permease subunit